MSINQYDRERCKVELDKECTLTSTTMTSTTMTPPPTSSKAHRQSVSSVTDFKSTVTISKPSSKLVIIAVIGVLLFAILVTGIIVCWCTTAKKEKSSKNHKRRGSQNMRERTTSRSKDAGFARQSSDKCIKQSNGSMERQQANSPSPNPRLSANSFDSRAMNTRYLPSRNQTSSKPVSVNRDISKFRKALA